MRNQSYRDKRIFLGCQESLRSHGCRKVASHVLSATQVGHPPFKLDATKIKVERNYSFGAQMLESMGDYSNSINVSGGDVFYKCECQAKHVTVTYWDKSGILDVEEL